MNLESALKEYISENIIHRPKRPSQIIDALKHHGIPGSRALTYYKNHELSYLIRKVWHFRYILESDYPIKSKTAFFQGLIEYNKFPETDRFFELDKHQQAKYKKGDYEVLYNAF